MGGGISRDGRLGKVSPFPSPGEGEWHSGFLLLPRPRRHWLSISPQATLGCFGRVFL